MIEKIFLIHHTHVDLGFTDDRDKVLTSLVSMIDRVSDLVDSSAARPTSERFRWANEDFSEAGWLTSLVSRNLWSCRSAAEP